MRVRSSIFVLAAAPFVARVRAQCPEWSDVYTLDFNAWMSANPGSAPKPGTTAYLQAWFRDPGNGSNKATSFSDALRVLVCP